MAATRVSSARLVGRSAELAELRAALREATDGRPSLTFVAGESGVGKTRLLDELAAVAREGGADVPPARVLSGDCIRLGSGEFPYAPLAAALRPLARDDDPVLRGLPAPTRAELGRILPGLAPAGDGPAAMPAAGAGPDADQARLFEALLTALVALAEDRPLVLAVEDLHWADTSTRAFLSFLSRSLCDERILVVATYRPDELHRRHPLRPVLAEVERESRSRRIALGPLGRDELGELLGAIVGAPADEGLVERLWRRAEGNPLFSEELLAADLDGRGPLPPTLRDALMVRIDRLPDPAQTVLRTLAVGQRLTDEVLADASRLSPSDVHPALREALAAHVVAVVDDGAYAFRHALLREVVEDDLLPGERASLHLRLAEALERRIDGPEDVARTSAAAHHYLAGDAQPLALGAAIRAASAAERVRAHGEEADLLERALGLWAQVPDAEVRAGASHVEVVLRAAAAQENAGALARAEALLVLALEQTDEVAAPRDAAHVLRRLAQVRWSQVRADEALETARRGLALLEHDRSVERARLLGWWARVRMLQGRFREAIEVAREVLVLASEVDDPVAEFSARNALGIALAGTGDPDGGARELRRAIALADLEGRGVGRSSAYVNLAETMHMAGRTREALEVLRDGRDLTRPRTHTRAWIEAAMSEYALALGDWEQADAFLAPVGRWMWDNGRLNVLLRRAELALARGDDPEALALLDEAEPLAAGGDEPQFHGPIGIARATLELRAGDPEAAWRAVETALERIEFCTEDTGRIVHVATWGVRVAATAAQAARDRRTDPAAAISRAEAMAERVEAAATTGGPVEAALRLAARAELACARGTGRPQDFLAVADAWRALDYPYAVATALRRAAELAAEVGARDVAASAARDGLALAERLGSRWLLAELRGLVARARLPLAPPAPDPGAMPGGTADAAAVGTTGSGAGRMAGAGSGPTGGAGSGRTTGAGSGPTRGAGSARMMGAGSGRTTGVGSGPTGSAGSGRSGDAAHRADAPDGPADPFGLTPRERQVLALVAGGATNREIGATLFMAEKTASVHVSRILAKLGVRSRTEAAAVAHRTGLADDV